MSSGGRHLAVADHAVPGRRLGLRLGLRLSYDVSDCTGVHPEQGTLADLDELIAQAGRGTPR